MQSLRRPAPAACLERRRAFFAGRDPAPHAPGPRDSGDWRRLIVATCRAEIEWASDEWHALGGDSIDIHANAGPHPSEAWRLPHEVAAARLVNCHLHVDVESWRLRELLRRLPGQRRAARDISQSAAYRASWQRAADGTVCDLRAYRHRRSMAWRAFLDAATRYRALRREVDRLRIDTPHGAPLDGPTLEPTLERTAA